MVKFLPHIIKSEEFKSQHPLPLPISIPLLLTNKITIFPGKKIYRIKYLHNYIVLMYANYILLSTQA